jgi:deoxyxylulose-5-phosphate synthase
MAKVSICGCAYNVGVTNMVNVSITGAALITGGDTTMICVYATFIQRVSL